MCRGVVLVKRKADQQNFEERRTFSAKSNVNEWQERFWGKTEMGKAK